MNKKRFFNRRGLILVAFGCFAAVVGRSGAQWALAQQKVEPITVNFAAYVAKGYEEMGKAIDELKK